MIKANGIQSPEIALNSIDSYTIRLRGGVGGEELDGSSSDKNVEYGDSSIFIKVNLLQNYPDIVN